MTARSRTPMSKPGANGRGRTGKTFRVLVDIVRTDICQHKSIQ